MFGDYKKCAICDNFLDDNDEEILVVETENSQITSQISNNIFDWMQY
jgi:hypothetical protein